MNEALLNFKGIIDEEIQAYEELNELYKAKQSILTKSKNNELLDIDAQIIQKSEIIKALNNKRKELGKFLGNEDIKLSDIIEKTKPVDEVLAGTFESQRAKIKKLAKSLSLQDKINKELIKHGLVMTEKKIGIICGAFSPQTQQYDKNGHNIKNKENLVSSITEEA